MATSYAAIERALLKQAKKDGDAYAAERRKKAESALRAYTADTEAAYAAKKAAWFSQARGEAADAVDARRDAAVQAALTRRQIRLKLADRGLAGSGTAAVADAQAKEAGETAVAEVNRALREKSDKINHLIGQGYRQMKQKQTEKRAALINAAEQDIVRHRASLERSAYSRAVAIARSKTARTLWEKGSR